jgi:hypothetical protein
MNQKANFKLFFKTDWLFSILAKTTNSLSAHYFRSNKKMPLRIFPVRVI